MGGDRLREEDKRKHSTDPLCDSPRSGQPQGHLPIVKRLLSPPRMGKSSPSSCHRRKAHHGASWVPGGTRTHSAAIRRGFLSGRRLEGSPRLRYVTISSPADLRPQGREVCGQSWWQTSRFHRKRERLSVHHGGRSCPGWPTLPETVPLAAYCQWFPCRGNVRRRFGCRLSTVRHLAGLRHDRGNDTTPVKAAYSDTAYVSIVRRR